MGLDLRIPFIVSRFDKNANEGAHRVYVVLFYFLLSLKTVLSNIAVKSLKLWSFAYKRLLDKPFENGVTLRKQYLSLNTASLSNC